MMSTIFFAASSSGLKDSRDDYVEIVRSLRELGYAVQPSWIAQLLEGTNPESDTGKLTVLEKQEDLLRRSDIMIVECSRPSLGIGYLIHQSINERRPILCMYNAEYLADPLSDMVTGNHSTLLKNLPI